MATLPLAPDGAYTLLVDDCDLAVVREHVWRVSKHGPVRYAMTAYRGATLYVHRLLMGPPPARGMEVDHRNRDGLDCRRQNLRWATRSQNAANSAGRPSSSRYKGVHWDPITGKWRARVTLHRRTTNLGRFSDEAAAARAYDVAADDAFGEFARPNFGASP